MPALSLSGQSKQRQVVILAVGGLLLAGLLMFQVPRIMKMTKSEGVGQPPPQTETTATPAPTAPVATPATPTPGAPPLPVSTTPSAAQSVSLARFTSKDPFVQQINPNGSAGPASGSAAPAPAPSEPSAEAGSFTAVEPAGNEAAGGSARIAVNGAEETVGVSDTFPKGNPVFKLASVSGNTAKIGVASGTLKGGSQTVTLTKGEPLTLLNTVDGKRYKLELVAVSE